MLVLLLALGCGSPSDSAAPLADAPCEPTSWYADTDGDGFGGDVAIRCRPLAGDVPQGGDCDDTRPDVHPGALELCNGVDDDCDGLADDDDPSVEPTDLKDYFFDADGDGFGDPERPARYCVEQGPPFVTTAGDCDDDDPDTHPGAPEVCGGDDEDCDGLVDGDDPDLDPASQLVVFRDADGDGHGDPLVSQAACDASPGWALSDDDCDDADGGLAAAPEWAADADGDGFGAGSLGFACVAPAPDAIPVDPFDGEDCDDADAAVNPSALDVCGDGLDQDCDGLDAVCGPTETVLDDLWVARWAGVTGDEAGYGLALGDLDDDGAQDLAIGAPFHDPPGLLDAGAAWVLPYAAGGDLRVDSTALRVEGILDDDFVGEVLDVGDLTGDGRADLAIGSMDGLWGRVWILEGPLTGPTTHGSAVAWFHGDILGNEMSGRLEVGDLNGDGIDDLVLSGPRRLLAANPSTGAAYVFFGPIAGEHITDDAHVRIESVQTLQEVGEVTLVHDVDGDGSRDLLVGAPGTDFVGSYEGAVYLFDGPLVGGKQPVTVASSSWLGDTAWGAAGEGLHAVGDLDGDGLDDVLVYGENEAWLVPGGDHGAADLGVIAAATAPITSTWEPGGAAGVDLDGDGNRDLVLGEPDGNVVTVILGPVAGAIDPDTDPAVHRFVGGTPGDRVGQQVLAVDDADGDGLEDLLVTAPGNDTAEADAGAVWLLTGASMGF